MVGGCTGRSLCLTLLHRPGLWSARHWVDRFDDVDLMRSFPELLEIVVTLAGNRSGVVPPVDRVVNTDVSKQSFGRDQVSRFVRPLDRHGFCLHPLDRLK